MEIQVHPLESAPTIPLAEGGGIVRAIIWPGTGSRHRTFHHYELSAGQNSIVHCHPVSEAVYYVLEGSGWVEDLDLGQTSPLRAGQMFHITAGTRYRMGPDAKIELLGGPCPPDPQLYPAPPPER